MGFHDNLAGRALLNRKTSEQFSSAARKHANATWFYIIIGAVVWWLTSWVWAYDETGRPIAE